MGWFESRTPDMFRRFATARRRRGKGGLTKLGEFVIETFGGGQPRPRR